MADTINDRDISIISAPTRLDVIGANYIYITGTSQIFKITNTGPTPSTITLTANLVGQLSGNCTFTVISGTATISASNNTCTINAADMLSDSLVIRASLTYLGNTYTADYLITEINETASIALTKDNIVIPTDSNGANGNFTQATLSSSIFVGNNIDTSNWTFATSISPANFITYTGGTGLGSNQITISDMNQLIDTGTLTITATKTGYTTLSKSVVVSKAKSGSIGVNGLDGLTFDLSSDSVALPADSAGTVTSFTGATTTAKVYRGASDDTSNWTITAVGTNLTFTFNNATNTATVTALSADLGYIEFTATRSGYSTLTTRYNVTKAKAGINAKAFNFSSSSQIFSKNKAGTLSPSVITLSANKQNVTGTVTWTANPAVTFRNAATSGTAVTTGDTVYLYSSDYGSNTSVTITATVIDSGITYTDTETILLINEGTDSITLALSNASVSLSSSSAGTVSSYTGSGTTIKVFEGSTSLTYVGTITTSSTFTIGTPTITPAAGITVGARSGTGSVTAVVADHSGMSTSADVVTISYPLTVRRSNGTNSTYTLTQTISKSKTGADSTVYYVTPSASVIQKSISNVYTPATVTFNSYSVTGSGAPTAYLGRFIISTTTDGTTYNSVYTSTGNESSYTYTVPDNIKALRVRLYQAGGTTTQYDEETIPIVADGLTGSTGTSAISIQASPGYLLIPTDSAGGNQNYTNASFTIKVFNGTTDDTANWTLSRTDGANLTSSITSGTVSIASLTADVSYVDCSATRAGYSTQNIRVPVSKAKAGATGAAGTNGTNGQRGSVTVYITGQSSWSDAVANTYFTTNYGNKVLNDTVTMTGTNFAQTRFWDGIYWIQVNVAVDGNLLVSGTVSASKLVANTITAGQIATGTITATQISTGTITADKLVTGTITAASGVIGDLAVTTVKIADYAVTIPDISIYNISGSGTAASLSLTGAKQLTANRPVLVLMSIGTSSYTGASLATRTALLQYSTDGTTWTTLETIQTISPVVGFFEGPVYGDFPVVSFISGITPSVTSNYYFRIFMSTAATVNTVLAVIQGKK